MKMDKPTGAFMPLDEAFGIADSIPGVPCPYFVTQKFYDAIETVREQPKEEREYLLAGLVTQLSKSIASPPPEAARLKHRTGMLIARARTEESTMRPLNLRMKARFKGPKNNPTWVLIDAEKMTLSGPWQSAPRPPTAFKNLVEAYAVEEYTKDGPPCPYWVNEKFWDAVEILREYEAPTARYDSFLRVCLSLLEAQLRDPVPPAERGDRYSEGSVRKMYFNISAKDEVAGETWEHGSAVTMTFGRAWAMLDMDVGPKDKADVDTFGVSRN